MLHLFAALAAAAQCPAAGGEQHPVRVTEERAALIHAREFVGSYDQHVEALAQIRKDFSVPGAAAPLVIGIYPDDPDAVGMANVRWQLAVKLDAQRSAETADRFFQRLNQAHPTRRASNHRLLLPGKIAILPSTIRRSREDGLAVLRWLACNNFAQVGPTRMEYPAEEGGLDAPVRIVVPVEARQWGGPG